MKRFLFISDFHLNSFSKKNKDNEDLIVEFLENNIDNFDCLFLLGDIFDFWFTYSTVVPKGYIKIFSVLSLWKSKNKEIHFFIGNHDMWIGDYLSVHFNAKTYYKPTIFNINNLKVMIGHGDGLGNGDYKYKLLKKIFQNKFCIFLFKWIHPDIGIRLANFLSTKSRKQNIEKDNIYTGHNNEWLINHCKEILKTQKIDYFLFGHRHLPIFYQFDNQKSIYINTGDWINYFTYGSSIENSINLYQYGNNKKNNDFSYT